MIIIIIINNNNNNFITYSAPVTLEDAHRRITISKEKQKIAILRKKNLLYLFTAYLQVTYLQAIVYEVIF